MGNIKRNSAKCTACGIEIESTHRHDFQVHYCKVEPTPKKEWVLHGDGTETLEFAPCETTWRFAIDGGKAYIRRCGVGFEDTSIYE